MLDYVLEALRFLASEEAADIPDDAVITPLRQEQLKSERSGRFREVDVALRVEWSARTEVVTFLIEEESALSQVRVVHEALPQQYFAKRGLVALLDQWRNKWIRHAKATAHVMC